MTAPRKFLLDGGMELYALTTDRFKTACLTVSAAVPADAAAGPLNTLLLSVMGRGTARHPSLAVLNRSMDMLYDLTLYSRNYRMGDLQILGSGAYFLDPRYLPASEDRAAIEEENVRMLSDSLYAPLYDRDGCLLSDYVEKEKTVQCDQIRDERNQPSAYAEQRSRELTFADSPHGVSLYGTVDGVSRVTARELTDAYEALLPHAALRFFYVGSTEGERMAELISRSFAKNGRPVTDGRLPVAVPPVNTGFCGVPLRTEETLPCTQGKLVMTLSAGGTDLRREDVFTAMVYNEILGGSPTSKLFVNVREKESLCYYCSSVYDFYKGYFSVASGIRCENREKAEASILRETSEMRRGNISDAELASAVRYLSSVYRSLYDSASSIENYFLARVIYGVSCTPEEARRAILSVTKEDVVRFASTVTLQSVYFLRGTRAATGSEDEE